MTRPLLSPAATELAKLLAKSGGSLRPAGMSGNWWCVWLGGHQVGGFIAKDVALELVNGGYLTEKRAILRKGMVLE